MIRVARIRDQRPVLTLNDLPDSEDDPEVNPFAPETASATSSPGRMSALVLSE